MRAELVHLMVKWMNGRCECGWGENRSNKYKSIFSNYGPLKVLEVPLLDIIKKMEMVPSEERKYHSGSYHGFYHEPTSEETLPGQLEPMKKKASICLDCIQSGTTATPCNFQHE